MEKKLNLKNLRKKVDEVINLAALPDTPEMRRTIEDLLLDRTDRYTEEELDEIDSELAKRIMGRVAAESAKEGVETHYDVPEREVNVMYG